MTASEALERLYAVSPREFTRMRNNLAAELRHTRNADAARTIAGLRRPSAPLWAINQLGRHARAPLERFLDAVERLRRTQLSDPRAAMEAMRTERTQLEALVTRAEEALRAERYGASTATRRRIGDTLLGAAADRRHADALLHGRLTQELEAPGFDALTAAPPRLRVVQGGARHEPGTSRQSRRQAAAEERRRQREAAADARRRAAEARRQEAETRRREAAEQAAAVAALQREAAAARERLADIERRLKQARRRAR